MNKLVILSLFLFSSFVFPNENLSNSKSSENFAVILKSGYEVYLRTYYDENRDLVQRLHVFDQAVIGDNNPFNFYVTYLIPNTNLNTSGSILTNNVPIHGCYDDACPMNYNGTYIGANHGCNFMLAVNVASHDKTVEDIGSEWIDSSNRKYYILRIVSSTQLWVISENIGTEEKWLFDTSISGNVLTHSENATHTTNLTISSSVVTQLTPAIKNQSKKLFLGNGSEVIDDGLYISNSVKIIEQYQIVDPASALEYVISQVGSAVQPALNQGDATVTLNIEYLFDIYGGCSMKYSVELNKMIDVDIISGIQSNILNKGSYPKIYAYIPGSLPIDGWDLTELRDFSVAPASNINIDAAYWSDPNNPPYRFLEYLGNDTSNLDVAFMQAFNIDKGTANPEIRKTLTNRAGYIDKNTRKTYPFVINDLAGNVAQGSIYNIYAYRGYSDPNRFSNNATSVFLYEDGAEAYLYADYHRIALNDTITLPDEFNNRVIEIIDQNQNIEILTEYIDSNRIIINSNSDYAYAYLKLKEFLPPESVSIAYSIAQADISWASAYGADSYNIYRSVFPDSGFSVIGTSTTSSFTDYDISGSDKYFYRVTAVNQ